MRKSRLVKDIAARHFMLGIAVFAVLFLLIMGLSLFFKALPIMKEKNLWVLLTSADWKPFKGDFGFLPFILSTILCFFHCNYNCPSVFSTYKYLSEFLCFRKCPAVL